MTASSISAGIQAMRRRPGVAVLLFLVTASLGYLVASPIGAALNASLAELASSEELDLVILLDFLGDNTGLIGVVGAMLLLLIPLMFLWSAASTVGVAYAMRDGAVRSFWRGVGDFFWRGLGISGVFLLPVLGWIVVVAVGSLGANLIWTGEVAVFWIGFVFAPTILAAGLAALDLARDYAIISAVTHETRVLASVGQGFRYLLGNGSARLIYLAWFVPAAVLFIAPSLLEIVLGASLVVFFLQQLLLLGRSTITVGWMASQVSLYERLNAGPDIASTADSEAA